MEELLTVSKYFLVQMSHEDSVAYLRFPDVEPIYLNHSRDLYPGGLFWGEHSTLGE